MSCKGKDHANCGPGCMWVREHTDKRGRIFKAHCQKKPDRTKKSASPPKKPSPPRSKKPSPPRSKKASPPRSKKPSPPRSKKRTPHKVIDLTGYEPLPKLKVLESESDTSSDEEEVFVGKTNKSRVIEDELDEEYEKAKEWAKKIPIARPSQPVYDNKEPVNVLQVRRKPKKVVPTVVSAAPVTPAAAPVPVAAPVNVLQVRRKPKPVSAVPAPAVPAPASAPVPVNIVDAVPMSLRTQNAPTQCIKAFQRFYEDLPTNLQAEVKPFMPANVSKENSKKAKKVLKPIEKISKSKSPEKPKVKLSEKKVQSAVKAMVTKFIKREEEDIEALEEQIIDLYTKNELQPDPEFLIDQGERIYEIEYVDITDTYREEADAEDLEAQEDLHNFVDDIMAGDFVIGATDDFYGTLLKWFKEYKAGTARVLVRTIAKFVLDTGHYESASFQEWVFNKAKQFVKDEQPQTFVSKVVDDISVLRAQRYGVELK